MQQGDNGFGNSVILNYQTGEPRAQAVIGFDWERYGRRQQDLEKKKARCQAVENWIDGIEDVQARTVFRMEQHGRRFRISSAMPATQIIRA